MSEAQDRIFTAKTADGKEVELRYKKPSQSVLSKADFVFREHFSKAVRAGVMTSAEAEKLLADRAIWTEKEVKELSEARNKLFDIEDKFTESLGKDEGLTLYRETKALRGRIEMLQELRKSIMDNTAENIASEMKNQLLASECVVYHNSGSKVFKDLADFNSRLDDPMTIECYRQVLLASYQNVLGIDLDKYAEKRPVEDVWLDSLDAAPVEEDLTTVVEEEKEQEPAKEKTVRRRRKKSE